MIRDNRNPRFSRINADRVEMRSAAFAEKPSAAETAHPPYAATLALVDGQRAAHQMENIRR
jgi:hypothetical protein